MDDYSDPYFNQGAMDPSPQLPSNLSDCFIYKYNQNVIPSLFFLMFPIALLLNAVAAWVSLHLKATSTFVVYLKNLVVADIIVTLMIPMKAGADMPDAWQDLIVSTCRFFSVVFYNAQYTCIALLGCISLDRFFKIMMPRSTFFVQRLTFSKVISGTVWLLLFGGIGLPTFLLTNKQVVNLTTINRCTTLKGPAGIQFHEKSTVALNVFFWFVSLILVVCYICITNKVIQSYRKSGSNNNQGKHKIRLRVFMVIIVFFVCFGPYHLIRIPYTFQQVSYSETKCSYLYELMRFAKALSHWLATTNVCMDPLLYVFLCREFKKKLMSMMKNVIILFKVATGSKLKAPLPH